MADVSKITLPNGDVYNIKDSISRNNLFYVVKGTHTTSTNTWTGKLSTIDSLVDGTTIMYIVPMDSPANDITLTLTTGNNQNTTAPIYVNNQTKLSSSTIKAGTVIVMTYLSANSMSFNGASNSTNKWICVGGTSSWSEILFEEEDNSAGGKTASITEL